MDCNPFRLNLPGHSRIVKAICCLKIILYGKREGQLAYIAGVRWLVEARCSRPEASAFWKPAWSLESWYDLRVLSNCKGENEF